MLTITLTDTGYTINLDDAAWISQPFDPRSEGFTPFASQDEALAHAQAIVDSYNAAAAAAAEPVAPEATVEQ